MLVFKDILGHEQIKDILKIAVETGKVSHAYILSGEAGMGAKIPCKCLCTEPFV